MEDPFTFSMKLYVKRIYFFFSNFEHKFSVNSGAYSNIFLIKLHKCQGEGNSFF